MKRIIEIRSYQLKLGNAVDFQRIMLTESVPLHKAFGIEIVAHGPSLHGPDTYFLVRAFDDLQDLNESQKKFYASDAWRNGPRESIVAAIESDANAVMWVNASVVEMLKTVSSAA
jgi:NIPSNAP